MISSGQLQGEDKTSTGIEKTRDFFQLMHYSIEKAAGMSDKAIKAHFALVLDSLLSDIDENCVNISVILKKYAYSARSLQKIRINSSINS